ncbi:MAG TPA: ParB N-terminal domain-containing protein [Leptospiraceae bacterium]|nr:ParB N-terminal domain-containing protein [Leptospiraceae bacterium]
MELKINSNYKIVPIDNIIPDPENAREHSKEDIEEKKAALKQFGWTRPCIINSETNIIAVGNGFWQAAKELGYTEVPAIFIPMSAVRAKALAISDNRLGDHGRYNLEQFNINIQEIAQWDVNTDWKALGFDKAEIDLLLASLNTEITNNDVPPTGNGQENFPEIEESEMPAKPIKLTNGQRELFDEAVKRIRKSENDNKLSEGRIVEMLAANFLASE